MLEAQLLRLHFLAQDVGFLLGFSRDPVKIGVRLSTCKNRTLERVRLLRLLHRLCRATAARAAFSCSLLLTVAWPVSRFSLSTPAISGVRLSGCWRISC